MNINMVIKCLLLSFPLDMHINTIYYMNTTFLYCTFLFKWLFFILYIIVNSSWTSTYEKYVLELVYSNSHRVHETYFLSFPYMMKTVVLQIKFYSYCHELYLKRLR